MKGHVRGFAATAAGAVEAPWESSLATYGSESAAISINCCLDDLLWCCWGGELAERWRALQPNPSSLAESSSNSLGLEELSPSLEDRDALLVEKYAERRDLAIELRCALVSVLVVGAAKSVEERVGRKPELDDEKGRRPTKLRRDREHKRRLEETEDSCWHGVGRGEKLARSLDCADAVVLSKVEVWDVTKSGTLRKEHVDSTDVTLLPVANDST